jgi:catechol 2,3-dioxygenase-like lactoylglutathione lyase family enzyme
MTVKIEKISAITLRVANMKVSVQFYGDVLGMKLVYGGKDAFSLRFNRRAQSCRSSIWNRVVPSLAGAG